MESKSSSPRAPVFGRKGAIYPGQSGTFGSFDRAKAGKFAGEFTETIQNDPPLKRFLSSSIVELLTFEGKCSCLRAKPAHFSVLTQIRAERKAHKRIQLVVYVCYVLESNRDNQSTTYRKAYERIRCIRSGRSKNLVEIMSIGRQNQPPVTMRHLAHTMLECNHKLRLVSWLNCQA